MRAGGLLVLAAALALAPAAQAQRTADPIDTLLRPPPKDADVEEPDTAVTGSAVDPDPELAPGPQTYRPYVPPPHPTLTTPVFVDETGRNPDPPATPVELAYDSRLKSSAASAQGFQGPMDGGWTLSAGGRALYAVQLVDKNGAVDGAWRDLRRAGAVDGSGYFEIVERSAGGLTFRFSDAVVAVLRTQGDRWAGELTEGGRREAVSLVRRRP